MPIKQLFYKEIIIESKNKRRDKTTDYQRQIKTYFSAKGKIGRKNINPYN